MHASSWFPRKEEGGQVTQVYCSPPRMIIRIQICRRRMSIVMFHSQPERPRQVSPQVFNKGRMQQEDVVLTTTVEMVSAAMSSLEVLTSSMISRHHQQGHLRIISRRATKTYTPREEDEEDALQMTRVYNNNNNNKQEEEEEEEEEEADPDWQQHQLPTFSFQQLDARRLRLLRLPPEKSLRLLCARAAAWKLP